MRVIYGRQGGFTIVEMLVTVVLAGLFVTFFVQMFHAMAAQQLSLVRQASAQDIAKSNLSKFPTSNAIAAVVDPVPACNTTTTPASSNDNNLTINASAVGTTLLNDSSSYKEADPGTIGELVQRVQAFYPAGCNGTTVPIKVESSVEYGFVGQRDKVVYAAYIF